MIISDDDDDDDDDGSNNNNNKFQVTSNCKRGVSTRDVCGGKCSLCTGLTTLPYLCAGCLLILGASTSWSPRACRDL